MGKVNHHKEHQEAHPEQQLPSKFSLFKNRISGLFKEIVEVPPEEIKPKEEFVEESDVPEIKMFGEDGTNIKVVPEEEKEIEKPDEEEPDEDILLEQERENTREKIHEHIVNNLNEAVAKWKETGEVGMHLEPPVPLKDKMMKVWERMKPASIAISAKLKNYADEVIEKVSSRLKKAEVEGVHVDAEVVIGQEWGRVLKKIEAVSPSSERDEIEKIYKELTEK